MIYIHKKLNDLKYNHEYFCEDLFGKAYIFSIKELSNNDLDEIVCDNIISKHIKEGYGDGFKFFAKFKNQWEELNKDEERILEQNEHNRQEVLNINNNNIIKNLRKKIKITIITLIVLNILFMLFFIIN